MGSSCRGKKNLNFMINKKKTIGIFVDSRKRSGGAYQELLYNIKNIKKHNKENFKFSIIFASKKLDIKLDDENIDVHYLSMNAFDRYICYLRNHSSFFRRFRKYLFFQNKIENFLKRKNIDLIYFTGPSQYSLYLEKTKFIITIPDVALRENLEFPEIIGETSSEFYRKDEVLQKALPKALAVITNAEIIKERISFFYRILKDRIYVINQQPSFIIDKFKKIEESDLNNFKKLYQLPQNYIFYPAMYLPHKNHRAIIDSIKILKYKLNLNFSVVFCGNDIGYLKNLKDYVLKEKLEKNIIFLDFIEDKYLPYFYLNSFALVMPALIGPTNIPPWEAFKMGVPVIYSRSDGIEEVLGNAVYYVDPLNPEDIAKGIKEIFENKKLKENLITKGKEKLSEVESKHEFKQFFEIIKKHSSLKKTFEFNS